MCINAANKSIAIAPSAIAYNNICAANNELKLYNKAITACSKALELDSKNSLAMGNMKYAKSQASIK